MAKVSKREKSRRVRILVERNAKRAGYSFWLKGGLIARWYYNDPSLDRRMGRKRRTQWWRASYDPKTFILKLLQPIIKPVEKTCPPKKPSSKTSLLPPPSTPNPD